MKFVAIGHITNDTSPSDHLGGGVSYTAVTAHRLGMESYIFTKCPPNHPYISELNQLGINVSVLPSQRDTITSFENIYDAHGKRTQRVFDVQDMIRHTDFTSMQKDILANANILVAPVIDEVSIDLIPELSHIGSVSITSQGYFRSVGDHQRVVQKRWDGFTHRIQEACVIMSEEDITINGTLDEALKEEIIAESAMIALTQGENGVTVYQKGKQPIHTSAFPLRDKELTDFTGAGDVFAAVFITELKRTGDIKMASLSACFFAAVKIMGLHGIGIAAIPTIDQLQQFATDHAARIDAYLNSEYAHTLSLLTH